MKQIIKLFAALFLLSSNANASELNYSVGQVWEYKNRPQDSGSLLKVQKIEKIGAGDDQMEVFHISVIGITYADPRGGGVPTFASIKGNLRSKRIETFRFECKIS
jgi:hypothetical protein